MYKNFMEWNKPVQVLFYALLISLIQSLSQVVRTIFIKWHQVQALESRSVNKALASVLFPFWSHLKQGMLKKFTGWKPL